MEEISESWVNNFAQKVFQQNKEVGWWDDMNRCIYTTIQLCITEVAEATEGERKNLMDDHLPHRKMGEVELGDALIRIVDLGGRFGLEYSYAPPHHYLLSVAPTIGKQHLAASTDFTSFGQQWDHVIIHCSDTNCNVDHAVSFHRKALSLVYSRAISTLFKIAELNDYDIVNAAIEKSEYNKTRADHKRENRDKEGGKQF